MAEPVGGPEPHGPDQVWSFRGYHLSPGEFNTAMVHFYRGEVTRSNTWRTRLDATTNWAVVATGAALSFAFSEPSHSHIMIPFNTLLITLFLYIEARRYRYYELWAYRVRLMETDFFAAMLAPPFSPSESWSTRLVDNLLQPRFTITFWEAFGRRFRRNYQWIFALLAMAWFIKVLIHPTPATSVESFLAHAAVGPVPGHVVMGLGLLVNLIIFAMGWLSAGLRESKGEILRADTLSPAAWVRSASDAFADRALFASRHEQLAHIICDKPQGTRIAQAILARMARGVTWLDGRGMYSGEEKAVLMVAIHPTQGRGLKLLVREIDPHAFVIIHQTEEVIGHGFRAPS